MGEEKRIFTGDKAEFLLDFLINSSNIGNMVCETLVQNGYGLEELLGHSDVNVRLVMAEQGFRADILANDPDWRVRYEIAKGGLELDTLVYDSDRRVREVATERLITFYLNNKQKF